jgi:hypothetical protein
MSIKIFHGKYGEHQHSKLGNFGYNLFNNIVKCISVARQRVAEHIPATYMHAIASIARQRHGKHAFTTIEEAVFSMLSAPRIPTRKTCLL